MLREDFPTLDAWAIVRDSACHLREDGYPLSVEGLADYCAELAHDAFQQEPDDDWREDATFASEDAFADTFDWREC